MSSPAEPALYLVRGSDESLVARALDALLLQLTAPEPDGDGGEAAAGAGLSQLGVEEHRAPGKDDELPVDLVLDALFTPPFFADRRLVVVRDAEQLTSDQVALLAGRLSEPFDPNLLVMTFVGKAPPAPLGKLAKAKGRVIDTSPPTSGRARTTWVVERLQGAPIHLDAAAAHLLEQHLGEDVARLDGLVELLTAAHGDGARIGVTELQPWLGAEGSAPPWDLTDALDRGDIATAISVVHRLLGPGERHPLQVMATLHRHYGAMLRLDGSGVQSAEEAAALVAMAPFPTRKVLEQGRRLGRERIARAIGLLAEADLALRGTLEWPGELVMEVLVARLAQLSGAGARARGRPRAGAGR